MTSVCPTLVVTFSAGDDDAPSEVRPIGLLPVDGGAPFVQPIALRRYELSSSNPPFI